MLIAALIAALAVLAAGKPELGERQAPAGQSDTGRLVGLLADYDATAMGNWVSLEALKDPTAHHEELPTWFRHLHDTMVVTSASNRREAQDATFILRQPLCPP